MLCCECTVLLLYLYEKIELTIETTDTLHTAHGHFSGQLSFSSFAYKIGGLHGKPSGGAISTLSEQQPRWLNLGALISQRGKLKSHPWLTSFEKQP